PLLSTKFSSRSISYVRVVDELPDVLAEKLSNGKMRLIALPPIEQDPKDEQTQEFQDVLAEAMLNDSTYQTEVDELPLSNENEPQKQGEMESFYHSSKSARDRDHLRQGVLESKGWTLHRICSTDWFSDPKREHLRLKQTLEKVLSEKRVSKFVTA